MVSVYEELSEASRRAILLELRSGPKSVTDIVASTGLKQPNVSNHLARMRQRGVVRAVKVGRNVYYSLASPDVELALQNAFADDEEAVAEVDLEILAKAYAKAAVQGDEATCQGILDRALRSERSILDVYEGLLTPAMSTVGTWFDVEAIDVSQEHMASAVTERMLARSVLTHGPVQSHGKVAVLGCAPNGWHVIGLRMVSDYLRIRGWRTLFLGANVPIESYVETLRGSEARLALLSCSADVSVADTLKLLRAISHFRGHRKDLTVILGGGSVGVHGDEFRGAGADNLCSSLRTFAETLLPEVERATA